MLSHAFFNIVRCKRFIPASRSPRKASNVQVTLFKHSYTPEEYLDVAKRGDDEKVIQFHERLYSNKQITSEHLLRENLGLLQALGTAERMHKLRLMFHHLEAREDLNIKPTLPFYNYYMERLVAKKQVALCKQLMQAMEAGNRRRPKPDGVTLALYNGVKDLPVVERVTKEKKKNQPSATSSSSPTSKAPPSPPSSSSPPAPPPRKKEQ